MLCFSQSSVPTLTWRTQLPSMWSVSCNIQHLAHEQSQHNMQWLMLWKSTFRDYARANTTNRHSAPSDNVIQQILVKVPWKQNASEPLEHCAACNAKRCLWQEINKIGTFYATKRRTNVLRTMWIESALSYERELKTQRLQSGSSSKIWQMLKRRDWQSLSLEQHLRRC